MISCAFDVDSVYLARPNSGPGLFDFHANVYETHLHRVQPGISEQHSYTHRCMTGSRASGSKIV